MNTVSQYIFIAIVFLVAMAALHAIKSRGSKWRREYAIKSEDEKVQYVIDMNKGYQPQFLIGGIGLLALVAGIQEKFEAFIYLGGTLLFLAVYGIATRDRMIKHLEEHGFEGGAKLPWTDWVLLLIGASVLVYSLLAIHFHYI